MASKQMSAEDSAKCLLSPATRDGWKITCKYLIRYQSDNLGHPVASMTLT